jgi:tRNA pseudouridine38-40 synthase
MRTLKLTLQYDGTAYVGWQRQASGTSVQGLLEDALGRIEGTAVSVQGAGRTDAGVHALAQVASVRLASALDTATLARALNATLPSDVRVRAVEEAAADFHARFGARGKAYEYRICNAPTVSPFLYRYAWHIVRLLDTAGMREASAALVGSHDFAAFQGSGSVVESTERIVTAIDWREEGGADRPLVMRIEGSGFLRHMVRNIVGTLVEVGLGRWPAAEVTGILASRDRRKAGPTAPPQGLFLVGVTYGGPFDTPPVRAAIIDS